MNPTADPLMQLRDLHLPDPISFWPPALGWWVVALIVLGLVALGVWVIRYRKKTAPRRFALAELAGLKASFHDKQDLAELMTGLSQLLRRYAMVCFGRQKVAGLTGVAWLKFLDEQGNTLQFSNETASQAFAAVPYGAKDSINAPAMMDLVERWIKHIPLSSRKKSI